VHLLLTGGGITPDGQHWEQGHRILISTRE
jgi:hypothetical protein